MGWMTTPADRDAAYAIVKQLTRIADALETLDLPKIPSGDLSLLHDCACNITEEDFTQLKEQFYDHLAYEEERRVSQDQV